MTSLKDQNKLLTDAGRGVTEGIKEFAKPFVKEAELKGMSGFKKIDSNFQEKLKKKKYLPKFKKNATLIPTKGNK